MTRAKVVRVLNALRLLAAEPSTQRAAFPDYASATNELVLTLEDSLDMMTAAEREDAFTLAQWSDIEAVLSAADVASQISSDRDLGADVALNSACWSDVRARTKEMLARHGWEGRSTHD